MPLFPYCKVSESFPNWTGYYLSQNSNLKIAFISKLRFITVIPSCLSSIFPPTHLFSHSFIQHLISSLFVAGSVLRQNLISLHLAHKWEVFGETVWDIPCLALPRYTYFSHNPYPCLYPIPHVLIFPFMNGKRKKKPRTPSILLVTEPGFLDSEGLALPTQCTMYQR